MKLPIPSLATKKKLSHYTDDELNAMRWTELATLSSLTDTALRYRVNKMGMTRREACMAQTTRTKQREREQYLNTLGLTAVMVRCYRRRRPHLSWGEAVEKLHKREKVNG